MHVRLITNLGYRFYAHRLHRFYNCDWMLDPRADEAPSEPIVPITVSGAPLS
jgi:hypothetical protein